MITLMLLVIVYIIQIDNFLNIIKLTKKGLYNYEFIIKRIRYLNFFCSNVLFKIKI